MRASATSTKRSLGSTHADGLTDAIVHGQDIARPLSRAYESPPHHVVLALDHVVDSRWYQAKRMFTGSTIAATDVDWSHGDGPATVRGEALDIVLVGTGRPSGLDGLSGPGVDELRDRLGHSG